MYKSNELNILYEDNHVLVVLKPPGVPSQPDRSTAHDLLGLLKRYIAARDQKKGDAWLGLIHRLDRPTSGLMVFAKTSKAASRMSKSFRSRDVKKYYVAIVRSVPDQSGGTLRDYLSAREIEGRVRLLATDSTSDPMTSSGREELDAHNLLSMTERKGEMHNVRDAKYAELAWSSICSKNRLFNEALLFIELFTGRRHQIRVQLAERGFPMLGDRRYGFSDERDLSVPTLALHACGLVFPHPVQKKTLAIYADPSINPSFTEEDAAGFNKYLNSLLDDGVLESSTL